MFYQFSPFFKNIKPFVDVKRFLNIFNKNVKCVLSIIFVIIIIIITFWLFLLKVVDYLF